MAPRAFEIFFKTLCERLKRVAATLDQRFCCNMLYLRIQSRL